MHEQVDSYLSNFQSVNGKVPSWLRTIRREAIARFAELGFPTTRLEDWKYTNVTPIAQMPFRLGHTLASLAVSRLALPQLGLNRGSQLVFVNGRYVPDLSSVQAMPHGTKVGSLAAVLAQEPDLVQPYLAHSADYVTQCFTALNTAFIQDGALVHLPKGTVISEPIHLVFLSHASEEATVSHPRSLIIADESSQATIIETYAGAGDGTYFTNAVTEIVVGPNAQLAHYHVQRESERAFHVSSVEARQGPHSRLWSYAVSLGGRLARTDINTVFTAEGGECSLDGLYMLQGSQHVDHHTTIDHQKPRCSSRELYKGVLDGKSTGVFNGKVYVRPNAQKSDAGQVNKNLLLSEDAVINTKPQLEIFADDVKCSHGATIGQLDDNALFYLRSRGIGAAAARDLLISAFAQELINRMDCEPVRTQLEHIVWSRLRAADRSEAPR